MAGGSSCGRDSLEGRQGIVQTVTRSALNSSAGTGSNDTNLLAVLPIHPSGTWRNQPPPTTQQVPDATVFRSSPTLGQVGPDNLGLFEAVTRGEWQQGLSWKVYFDNGVRPEKKIVGILV